MVDALLPADWDAATLDIGDALGNGSPTNPAPSFGAARLSIPLEKVDPEHEERSQSDGDPSMLARAARILRMSATVAMVLANLGYFVGAEEVLRDGVAAAHLIRHAIRAYVFRQMNRASPVRVDLFPQLVRVLAEGAAGDEALAAEDFLHALHQHGRAVHHLLEHRP
jgi:hypothetical protein